MAVSGMPNVGAAPQTTHEGILQCTMAVQNIAEALGFLLIIKGFVKVSACNAGQER
jgi:hypothetical protein